MKEIRKTTQFKKDFKRYSKDLERVKALFEIVRKLANDEPIPAEFKPHPLGGDITITWNVTSEMIICSSGMTRPSMSLNLSV